MWERENALARKKERTIKDESKEDTSRETRKHARDPVPVDDDECRHRNRQASLI